MINLVDLPFKTVQAYDHEFFPEDRTRFLRCWLKQPQGRALGMIQKGELTGYGVVRPCRNGHKIGPLFADSVDVAEILYASLTSGICKNEPIYLDVPEVNAFAVAMAEAHGMQRVFETARMYTREFPDLSKERQFGVTTFELG